MALPQLPGEDSAGTGSWLVASARFVLVFAGIGTAFALGAALLWYAAQVLLLTFGGIILAIFLGRLARWLSAHTRLSYGWSLAVVILALLGLLSLACWLLASRIASQVDQLTVELPRAARRLEQHVEHYRWERFLLDHVRRAGTELSSGNVVSRARTVLGDVLTAGVQALLVLLVGLYGAITPDLYVNGVTRLFPRARRPRVRAALHSAGAAL
jgi:predicted PurR-regulated permease PerM